MNPPPVTMEQVAELAEAVARDDYGVRLRRDSLGPLDRLLDRLRAAGAAADPALIRRLADWFGVWFGEYLVRQCGARWDGLDEPTPPRIALDGGAFGPIDAVGRRLANSAAPTMRELVMHLSALPRSVPEEDLRARNRAAWDALAESPAFANIERKPPPSHVEPPDPWLREAGVAGKDVLCLGAGGGLHGPGLAILGARATVLDFSPAQLAVDRETAERARVDLQLVEADLDRPWPLADASFDVVLQPVSACFVRDLRTMHREVARVLRPGGLYLVQHKSPAIQQSGPPTSGGFLVHTPAWEGFPLPPTNRPYREPETVEYVHTLDVLLGDLCRAGFVIEDFAEPPRGDLWAPPGSREHRAAYFPPYLKVKARRVKRAE